MRGRKALLIVAAAVAAGVFCFLFFTGRLPAMTVGPGAMHSLGRLVPESIVADENGLLYTEGSQLHCLQPSGQERWAVDLNMGDISTCTSSDLILNYAGPNLQVMQFTEEQLFATSVDSPILAGAAGQEYVAVLIDAPEDDTSAQQMIYLFDKSGQKSGQLSFSRQVIRFGFFSDETISDLFWTLSLDTSGSAPVSYITMYNKLNGEMTYSITISDRVVEEVFVTSNFIYASGSGLLTAYTYFGEAEANEPVQGWKPAAVAATSSALYAAYVPRADAAYIEGIMTIHADGATGAASVGSARFALPMDVLSAAITQSRVFAFTSDTMYVYTLSGTLERSQALGAHVSRVKQVSDSCAVLWGQNDSYILELE